MILTWSALAAAEEPDVLARRIAARCGDPYSQQEIAFTFVVVSGGVEKARRRHVWRPADDTLSVTLGDQTVAFTDLSERVAPGATPEQIEDGWGAFVNDTYWLLAPCKVFDPGVVRVVDEAGRLGLSFQSVGLTPGDRYWFTADASGQVTRWDYVLESGREGHWSWAAPIAVGGLQLSPMRQTDDGKAIIRFEGLTVR
jgi:hypothetical protein